MTIAILYLLGIVAAEFVTVEVDTVGGVIFHTILLFVIVFHSAFASRPNTGKLYLALALAPLTRIISLSMPLQDFTLTYSYLITSIPLLVAAFACIVIIGYQPQEVGLIIRKLPVQVLVALTGIGFGLVEYHILKPNPLIDTLTIGNALLPSLILLATTGFVEELMFRGIIQRSAEQALGKSGLVYVAILFSVLHIVYLSLTLWLLVLFVGLFFGYVVKKTGSLLGVIFSHGITNICLFVIFPHIIH